MRPPPRRFPPGFLWGAATSSHQVEGDNRWNDWWEYEQRGRVPYASGEACRQYQLFERDFDLARSWGHNAHRLSIEWSRFEPSEGQWSDEAAAHYRHVVGALRDRGLEPVVTLHHFTNPAWFARRGGWTRGDSPAVFARYVTQAARALGPVKYWITINEPTVYVMQGFVTGEWPPCLKGAWMQAARAFRNLARAHVEAYGVLHGICPDAMVGFAHSAPVIEPCNPRRRRDRLVAAVRDFIFNEAFFRMIAARPHAATPARGAQDFIGVNYYTRKIVRWSAAGRGALVGRECELDHHHRGPVSTLGWEVYPQGLIIALERFAQYGLPLLVTENGIATDDEALRRRFLVEHVGAAGEALARGVDLIGYLYWSLLDNFEWAFGTAPKFGLASVDYRTQERRARPCVADFIRTCSQEDVADDSPGIAGRCDDSLSGRDPS
jgi:beta-glucosidase